jgi:hypothetical protein
LKLEYFRHILKKKQKMVKYKKLWKYVDGYSLITAFLKNKPPPHVFNQHSILISQCPKSHTCVHNSVKATILSKINRCYNLLNISFETIPVSFCSHKTSYVIWTQRSLGHIFNGHLIPYFIYIYIYIHTTSVAQFGLLDSAT